MSKLKRFLDRRAKNVAKAKAEKEAAFVTQDFDGLQEDPVKEVEEDPNLTDDEFWAISNQFMLECKAPDANQVEILQAILVNYTPLKINQFAKRYAELNA